MRPLLLALALLLWLAAPPPAKGDDPGPGGAKHAGQVVAVEGKVSATLGADTRRVERGEAVYQNDWIETAQDARAKILLADETELVVGPGSRLHIDEFVYDAGSPRGKVLLEVGVGLLRFTSGKLEPESYEVNTPVASIGVRGTIFDVIVAAVTYATTVILRDGKIVIRTFGGPEIVDREDHASTAERSADPPEPQREVTDEEEKLADPLKRPFQDEIDRATRKPTVPANVPKPRVDPSQNRPSPSNRPSYPRGPRY